MAQKFHFAILRIEVTHASRGLSAIAELLVQTVAQKPHYMVSLPTSTSVILGLKQQQQQQQQQQQDIAFKKLIIQKIMGFVFIRNYAF